MQQSRTYLPAPEPDRSVYRDFAGSCKELYDLTGKHTAFFIPALGEPYGLSGKLSALGFRRFAHLAAGGSGITFETTEGQVVRIQNVIMKGDDAPRARVHEQLQPIADYSDEKFIIEVLPKLDTKVSAIEAGEFQRHIYSKHYDRGHLNSDNGDLGHLPDGTVVAVDKDGINAEFRDKPSLDESIDQPWLIASEKQSIFPYLQGSGFISKQEALFPAIADGRVRGVLSDAEIERLRGGELEKLREEKPEALEGVTEENLEEFTRLVKDEGWYPSQAMAIMREQGQEQSASAQPRPSISGR